MVITSFRTDWGEAIVVDNAFTDYIADKVTEKYENRSDVHPIRLEKNLMAAG